MRPLPHRAIWTGTIAAAFAVAAQAAAAVSADRAAPSPCTISGFLSDPGAKGIDIRGAPRADAPVIGRLPPPAPPATGVSERFGAEFYILGVRDGWLLIREADVEFDGQVKIVFQGPGWIPGDKAGFIIGSQELRAAPANDARVIAKLQGTLKNGDVYGPDSFKVLRVHACRGHFVDLTIVPPRDPGAAGAPLRGWIEKVCSNQKTTCDPAVADSPGTGGGR